MLKWGPREVYIRSDCLECETPVNIEVQQELRIKQTLNDFMEVSHDNAHHAKSYCGLANREYDTNI
jgi:hypothetical protein